MTCRPLKHNSKTGEKFRVPGMMTETLIHTALFAAYDAGQAIMEVYSKDISVEYKPDHSPLTLADKQAHLIISSKVGFPY